MDGFKEDPWRELALHLALRVLTDRAMTVAMNDVFAVQNALTFMLEDHGKKFEIFGGA